MAQQTNEAAAIPPSARIELFDGKDLTGWKFVTRKFPGNDTSIPPETVWTVKDGVLHFAGTPKINVQTLVAYRDYKLHVEWRWPEGRGNSGVFLHVTGRDALSPLCVEAQLDATNAGDLRMPVYPPDSPIRGINVVRRRQPSSEKAFGEWNSYDIECRGNAITVWVNGVLQNEVEGGTLSSGYIALQAEGKAIEFRNIWIEPLAKP